MKTNSSITAEVLSVGYLRGLLGWNYDLKNIIQDGIEAEKASKA